MKQDLYQINKRRIFDYVLELFPKKGQIIFVGSVILLIVISFSLAFINNINVFSQGKTTKTNTEENVLQYSKQSLSRPKPEENCYTDWIDFIKDKDKWEGLQSRFNEVNGVFSVPDQMKKVDSVAYYQKPCKGGIKTDLEFIPYSESLINLNMYYGNWFRWEIGGNDLNSVKLYKNTDGCTAFKGARPVETITKYLPAGEKIKTQELVYSSMLVFLTESGKLRTELHLKFTNSETGKIVEENKLFYYEFDVGLKCDQETVLNIENDYERIGIGLMSSFINNKAEVSRVKFSRFSVGKYIKE